MAIKDIIPFGKKSIQIERGTESPFAILRREIDSLFDNFLRGFELEPFESRFSAFSPKIDVVETDKEIKVFVELPGMEEKDIDISLSKDTLTIKGEKKEEKEQKGKDYYRMERSYGSFIRTIPLPVEVEDDKVDAKLKKGVLTIVLPKSAKTIEATKKISVKVE